MEMNQDRRRKLKVEMTRENLFQETVRVKTKDDEVELDSARIAEPVEDYLVVPTAIAKK